MNDGVLGNIQEWFSEYAQELIRKHPDRKFLMRSRLEHSVRVADDCREIADDLDWSVEDVCAADALGLLHDVGRFKQLAKHGTLADGDSTDHGELGWKIVCDEEILEKCDGEESAWILDGIKYHNAREMPADMDENSLHFLRLIRDVDKLDILWMIRDTIERKLYIDYPEMLLSVDPDAPVSPALLKEIQETKTCSYANMASFADVHLMKTVWIYEINYIPILKRIAARGLLDDVRAAVPDTPEVCKILDEAEAYMAERLSNA